MKPINTLIALASAAVFVVGCDKEKTPSEQIDQVKADTKEAAKEMKDYTYAQKNEFVASMQERLAAIDKEIERISVRIDAASDAAKADAKPKLAALRAQASRLEKQLGEVKDASESTWSDVKTGSRKAFDAVSSGLLEARQWVSDKIAP